MVRASNVSGLLPTEPMNHLSATKLPHRRFASQAEARMACFSFIEDWYNPVRLHSALALSVANGLRSCLRGR